jgi:molybdopterin molybdotransferase
MDCFMLNYNDAFKIVIDNFHIINKEIIEVDLVDSVNCILAEDIYSDINHPPFTNSAVDGFGIKYDENCQNWDIIGEISAGNFKDFHLSSQQTVSIMTGSKISEDIDTVIPIEDIIIDGNHLILKDEIIIKKGQNIRLIGNDLKVQQLAVPKNIVIKSQNIGLLASCGKSKLKVYRQLKIGVLTTGDELIDIDSIPQNDKIRSSNLYALLAQIKQLNMIPVNIGIVNDNKILLKRKITAIFNSGIDILITSGGVSVGKHDYIKEVLTELGADIKFWKANIKPGKPILFSTFSKSQVPKIIFSLPGNPLSCFVDFEIFVKRAIYEFYQVSNNNIQIAESDSNMKKKDDKKHFVIGNIFYDNDKQKMIVSKFNNQSSGNIYSLNNSNCFIVFPEEKKQIEKGEMVKCIMI